MNDQVYSIPGQTEVKKGRPFWNGKAYTYPMNYLLHVHHPIPTS